MLLLLLLPVLLASCGSIFQGPVTGVIQVDNPADAADAMVYLRCRGPGLHGHVQTDAEETRVNANGRFTFLGSLTFPTTDRCYVDIRHPRYLTTRVKLKDDFVQTLPTLQAAELGCVPCRRPRRAEAWRPPPAALAGARGATPSY